MATKLFIRDSTNLALSSYRNMITTAGSASTTGVVDTAASGTDIQWTKTAGGAALAWISGRVPAGGVTISGTMTFSIWAHESNMNANAGGRVHVYNYSGGSETEMTGSPFNDGVEFGTAAAEMTWTGTATGNNFLAENDRIVVKYYITNVGTMASGHTCTLTYDAADAATGDSFFQINENVTFKLEDITGTEAGNLNAVTAALTGAEEMTGTVASNLNPVTSELAGIETFTGTVESNLNAVTAALTGEVTEAQGNTGDIASTLSAVTAALAGEEAFLGTVAADLNAVTSALAGAETISGDIAGALSAVTTALAGDVVSPVEGTVAGTLAALTALIQGETDGAELDVAGPVFAKGTYKRLAKRRKKKREDLEALANDLRVLLGLGPDLPPGEPILAGAVASVDFTGGMATPFLVGIENEPLRAQVQRMLAAVKEIEARHAAALDDDDDAILALMEAA
jgi:hypothetical protein